MLNKALRDVLSLNADRTQTFHSLRHSLAGALKAAEIPVGTAESILGHASGSISYDLYGAGSTVEVTRLAEALKVALRFRVKFLTFLVVITEPILGHRGTLHGRSVMTDLMGK
ncbi:tyrosine-type recombinase/integrase [Pseudomonas sp. B21_DOA]|nr:tyrosine-type recombinase/integrase [Pseudomonas sp. B21_DOA]